MFTTPGTEHQDQESIAPYLIDHQELQSNTVAESFATPVSELRTDVSAQYEATLETTSGQNPTPEVASPEELCRVIGETAAWVIYARAEELNNNFRSAA